MFEVSVNQNDRHSALTPGRSPFTNSRFCEGEGEVRAAESGKSGASPLIAAGEQGRLAVPERVRASEQELERQGILPQTRIEQLQSRQPEILSLYERVREVTGAPALTENQERLLVEMSPDRREMFSHAANQLVELAQGRSDPARYMINNLVTAARLAEANDRPTGSTETSGRSANELFAGYINMVFSRETPGPIYNMTRTLSGASSDPLGAILEENYRRLIGTRSDGFDRMVVSVASNHTVTSHFRELFMAGFRRGESLGSTATRYFNNPDGSPGDVRLGHLAFMLGAGLANNRITPTEASHIASWALSNGRRLGPGGNQTTSTESGDIADDLLPHQRLTSPWGVEGKFRNYLSRNDYDLERWRNAYGVALWRHSLQN